MSKLDPHPSGLLADFAEGALAPREAGEVSRHLDSCAACRDEVESWRVLYHGLAGLPRPAVPAGLRLRILEAVAREVSAPVAASALAAKRRWMTALSWAYGAGVTLVGCLALGLAFVPVVREQTGTALAGLSTAGLRAGLATVDLLSFLV